jgi:hypothetical protein
MSLTVPKYIVISDRLFNDAEFMIEYSLKTDKEAGGMLIKAAHGHFGIASEQLGEGREIMLKPNEKLQQQEMHYGSVHTHPQTDLASTGDVISYLSDRNEKIMLVVGADKSINMYFKTKKTPIGDFHDMIRENFEQKDMPDMCEVFNFLWYNGNDTTLELQIDKLRDYDLEVADETATAEELADLLELKGNTDYPRDYSIKKYPKKEKKTSKKVPWLPTQMYDRIGWNQHGI